MFNKIIMNMVYVLCLLALTTSVFGASSASKRLLSPSQVFLLRQGLQAKTPVLSKVEALNAQHQDSGLLFRSVKNMGSELEQLHRLRAPFFDETKRFCRRCLSLSVFGVPQAFMRHHACPAIVTVFNPIEVHIHRVYDRDMYTINGHRLLKKEHDLTTDEAKQKLEQLAASIKYRGGDVAIYHKWFLGGSVVNWNEIIVDIHLSEIRGIAFIGDYPGVLEQLKLKCKTSELGGQSWGTIKSLFDLIQAKIELEQSLSQEMPMFYYTSEGTLEHLAITVDDLQLLVDCYHLIIESNLFQTCLDTSSDCYFETAQALLKSTEQLARVNENTSRKHMIAYGGVFGKWMYRLRERLLN